MSNKDKALIYRVYRQNERQWDDDPKVEVYYLLTVELEDEYIVHRYEVNVQHSSISLFGIEETRVQRRWFLDNHSLVEDQASILKSMLSTVKEQVKEMNARAVELSGFYRRFSNFVALSLGLS